MAHHVVCASRVAGDEALTAAPAAASPEPATNTSVRAKRIPFCSKASRTRWLDFSPERVDLAARLSHELQTDHHPGRLHPAHALAFQRLDECMAELGVSLQVAADL